MYVGKKIIINRLENNIVELLFDSQFSAANTLNKETIDELQEALIFLSVAKDIKGLLISSDKPSFILGADTAELQSCFDLPESELKEQISSAHRVFCSLENLPFPTVASVNGMALGGGFELALAADFRIVAADANVGLPEVSFGLCPRLGGTIRLARLIGERAALEFVLGGKIYSATKALKLGVVDIVAKGAGQRDEALKLLAKVVTGEMSFASKRIRNHHLRDASFYTRMNLVDLTDQWAKNFDTKHPAFESILNIVKEQGSLSFEQALEVEANCFVKLAQKEEVRKRIGLFMNEQTVNPGS